MNIAFWAACHCEILLRFTKKRVKSTYLDLQNSSMDSSVKIVFKTFLVANLFLSTTVRHYHRDKFEGKKVGDIHAEISYSSVTLSGGNPLVTCRKI